MINRNMVVAGIGALVLGLTLTAPAHGRDTARDTTFLTFSGAVALPGVTLPAGTYVFERVDANVPQVIRVMDRKRTKQFYMAFTDRIERPARLASDRPVTFHETRPGVPPRINAWYPIGEITGYAFIYR